MKGCLGCCVHRLSIKEGGEGDLSAFLTSSCEPILQRQHPVAVLAGSDRIGSDLDVRLTPSRELAAVSRTPNPCPGFVSDWMQMNVVVTMRPQVAAFCIKGKGSPQHDGKGAPLVGVRGAVLCCM